MSGTKEKYINVIQWKFVCKSQIALSVKSFVYVGYFISGIATTINEYNFGFRGIEESISPKA